MQVIPVRVLRGSCDFWHLVFPSESDANIATPKTQMSAMILLCVTGCVSDLFICFFLFGHRFPQATHLEQQTIRMLTILIDAREYVMSGVLLPF